MSDLQEDLARELGYKTFVIRFAASWSELDMDMWLGELRNAVYAQLGDYVYDVTVEEA